MLLIFMYEILLYKVDGFLVCIVQCVGILLS